MKNALEKYRKWMEKDKQEETFTFKLKDKYVSLSDVYYLLVRNSYLGQKDIYIELMNLCEISERKEKERIAEIIVKHNEKYIDLIKDEWCKETDCLYVDCIGCYIHHTTIEHELNKYNKETLKKQLQTIIDNI